MNVSDLAHLSYKELQALALRYRVPGNIKVSCHRYRHDRTRVPYPSVRMPLVADLCHRDLFRLPIPSKIAPRSIERSRPMRPPSSRGWRVKIDNDRSAIPLDPDRRLGVDARFIELLTKIRLFRSPRLLSQRQNR